jgi:hypothetical protein
MEFCLIIGVAVELEQSSAIEPLNTIGLAIEAFCAIGVAIVRRVSAVEFALEPAFAM